MVLGANKIVGMINDGVEVETKDKDGNLILRYKPLIEGLESSQIEGIEGTTVDLRLGAVYSPTGYAELLRKSRVTPKIELVMDIEKEPDGVLHINPGEFLLFQTIETVNMPKDLFAYIRPRTSLIRSCIPLETAFISPNYQGKLTVGMKHIGLNFTEIQMGFRILCICFFPIDGEAVPYHGVWQGDRVSTNGEIERPY